MANNVESPFALELAKNIRAKVAELKADGTVGMSVDNLYQVVRTPSSNWAGAPRGTNAPYYYKLLFIDVLATVKLSKFEIIK